MESMPKDSEQYSAGGDIDFERVRPYISDPSHLKYLDTPAFHEYISLEKRAILPVDADALLDIGDDLEKEYMPRHLNAAAWAFAEVGLTDDTRSAIERHDLIVRAESLWQTAATRQEALEDSEYGDVFNEPDELYRSVLPLAYTPLMKSIIVGNVTEQVRRRALKDTVALSAVVTEEVTQYREAGDVSSANSLVGLAHELNALSMLLYMDDARYVPFPSTARADTGYYHKDQTHDIMIANQHWGAIRRIIPVEVKARPTQRDRRRYKALLVRGKMHLTASGVEPSETVRLFENIQQGQSTPKETAAIEKIATELRGMIHLYGKGATLGGSAIESTLRFLDASELHRAHPEIAPNK